MNHFLKVSAILFFGIAITGCSIIEPKGVLAEASEPIETVMISTNVNDNPLVSYLAITIFGNKVGHLENFDFKLSRYILEQADSILQGRGYKTIVKDSPLPKETTRAFRSSKSSREVASRRLRNESLGEADVLILIEQGSARTGIRYNHGSFTENHGFFVNAHITRGRLVRSEMPLKIMVLDLRTGVRLAVFDFHDLDSPKYLEGFKHIIEPKDVTDEDKVALVDEYRKKLSEIYKEALALFKPKELE